MLATITRMLFVAVPMATECLLGVDEKATSFPGSVLAQYFTAVPKDEDNHSDDSVSQFVESG
jgi:hypothetical protein